MSQQETVTLAISPEQVPGIRGALLRYRIMAYLVGVLLVVLVLIGMPLKYFARTTAPW